MAYRTRSAKRISRKGKRSLLTTIIIIVVLLWVTLTWILPNLIGGVGFVKSKVNPSSTNGSNIPDTGLAPPVLNIPYEATNSAKIDISGYGSTDTKVKIYIDGDEKSEVDVSSDGTFVAKDIELSLGTNNISAKTIDKDKESLDSKTIRLILDTEKPKLEVNEPSDGSTTKERRIKITGVTDTGSQVFVNGNQTIVNSDGSFNGDYSLSDGDNNLTIKALDKAGNSTEVTRKVTFQP
jgi:hypothetical protein